MEDLSLHILDIAENSITAGATKLQIKIVENTKKNSLLITITDNGRGMDEETIKMADDPFFTTKSPRRVGLGIPLLSQAAKESMGNVTIESKKGQGTAITAHFQHNHIDRKPIGKIEDTLTILIAANPEIDFVFEYLRNECRYFTDTAKLRKKLPGTPINDPKVIRLIKDSIINWLKETKSIILNKNMQNRLWHRL